MILCSAFSDLSVVSEGINNLNLALMKLFAQLQSYIIDDHEAELSRKSLHSYPLSTKYIKCTRSFYALSEASQQQESNLKRLKYTEVQRVI